MADAEQNSPAGAQWRRGHRRGGPNTRPESLRGSPYLACFPREGKREALRNSSQTAPKTEPRASVDRLWRSLLLCSALGLSSVASVGNFPILSEMPQWARS